MTDQIRVPRSLRPHCRGTFLLAAIASVAIFAVGQEAVVDHADRVVVHKKERTLELFKNGLSFRKYKIALGAQPAGPKTQEGDHKTPEGVYVIDRRNEHSKFYRALHISYPNADDQSRAERLGVSPEGDIMIHGLPNGFGWLGASHRMKDWTDGCIAVTDKEMDEIWQLVPDGTSIEIAP